MFTSAELRKKYLDFFASKGHAVIPSASLIPENDPTVLFTTAGMHPLVPFLLGEKHPSGNRLTNVQKCVRLQDIDEVGDNRHNTFFEMLGNWSLGDYWKKEAIEWSWEFLTDKKWLGLDPKKLAVTVFAGDDDAPFDVEAFEIWKQVGLAEERIAKLPKKDNWWGPAGQTGPCGSDTEMFFWKGESTYPPAGSNPGNDPDNWLEIWNDVFMQYDKTIAGKYKPLKQKNVDTGMGLERTLVALSGFADVFQIDTFWPLILKIQEISGREYIEDAETIKAMRVVADHLRTAAMIMGDDKGVAPSNVGQGYVIRRLIRRAVRYGRLLGIKENFCDRVAEEAIKIFKKIYPEVERNRGFIVNELAKEESKFRNTIEGGLKEFEKLVSGFRQVFEQTGEQVKEITGHEAFKLYESYGFPLEMTLELANENGLTVEVAGFESAFKAHQDLSRTASAGMFKGGLADAGPETVRLHTAAHLLMESLRRVLGEHVSQRGSNITAERLRLDFSHPEKISTEQIKKIEAMVNEQIQKKLPVHFEELSLAEAKKRGSVGVFERKYGEKVKVYFIGQGDECFSKEICGGPHVANTAELGTFKILKEESASAGTRRIKAILE